MDKVTHFEVPFDDKEKCKEFYGDVFGWKFQDMEEMPYTMAYTVDVDEKYMPKESGAINGGMYKRDENSAQGPVIVIDVASIDEKLEKIKQAGGDVFREKIQVGDMGWYAQVRDPEGNIIGIWQTAKKE